MNEGNKADNASVTASLASVESDTPARAFILQVKLPSGNYGRDKCIQRGLYCDKQVTYLDVRSKLRDGCSFRTEKHPRHHIGVSRFLTLHMDMIITFLIDYIRLVLLGMMKRMFDVWLHGLRLSPHCLILSPVETLGRGIASFQKHTPCDFQRLSSC